MYVVRKINGRLVITKDGQTVYHMPFWVRVRNRTDMQWLADRFNQLGTDDISAIMEFEGKYSTIKKRL